MHNKQEDYKQSLALMKQRIETAQQTAILTANAQMLFLYWELGVYIREQQQKLGWGSKIIQQISTDLKQAFPFQIGYSVRNLKYMLKFADTYPPQQIVNAINQQTQQTTKVQPLVALLENSVNFYDFMQTPLAKISWSHHLILLDKTNSEEERNYYTQRTIQEAWTKRVLIHQIEQKLFESQGNLPNNFDSTLANTQAELAKQTLKSEYVFDFLHLEKPYKERALQTALLQKITQFLLTLGKGFAFLGQEYHLQVSNKDYYLDLLFYHTQLRAYFIIELKIDDFMPEYVGKLNFYINACDSLLKTEHDQATIGLLLCKTADTVIVEYSLKDSNKPIGVATYKLLPKTEDLVDLITTNDNK